jgi:hypothetical protein
MCAVSAIEEVTPGGSQTGQRAQNGVYEANNVNACIGKVRDDLCFVKNKEALLLKSRIATMN